VGFLVVSLGQSELVRAPLVTLATVERGSFLEVLWGGLRLAWAHVVHPTSPGTPTLPHFRWTPRRASFPIIPLVMSRPWTPYFRETCSLQPY